MFRSSQQPQARSPRSAIIVIAILALAMLEFIVRTPMHGSYKMWDFACFYASARAWVAGDNPYVRGAMADVWQQAGGRADIVDDLVEESFAQASPDLSDPKPWLAVQFIPAALPVVAPFALLPAEPAQMAWSSAVYALMIAQVFAVAYLMRWPWLSYRTGLLAAAMLVLEPLHLGIAVGQPSTPTISLILLAMALTRDTSASTVARIAAGLLLACAAALKPHLALPFVAFLGWRRDWLAAGSAVGFFAMLWLGATMPMSARGIDWMEEWRRNLVWAQTSGIDTADRSAPFRHAMLNLQVLLHAITDSRVVVNAGSLAIVAALALTTVGLRSRIPAGTPHREQTVLAAVAVLTLLPVYHRYYDATLLLLPIGWAIDVIARRRGQAPRLTSVSRSALFVFALCMITFAAPYNWIEMIFRLPEDAPLRQSWWWSFLLVPHRCLVLLTITATLLAVLNRLRILAAQGTTDLSDPFADGQSRDAWSRAA